MDENGVQTTSRYDDLGRVVAAYPSGKSPTQTSYAGRVDDFGGLNGTVTSSTVDSAKAILIRDAFGREIKSSENKFDNTFAEVDTAYDILGRVIMHSRPHASQVASAKTSFSYDPLSRLLKTTLPNAATIVSVPSFSQTQTMDADHHQSSVVRDVANRVVNSSNVVSGVSVSTSYRYAPSGKVDRVTDALGNEIHTQYDVLDRVIRQRDPDAGTTALAYDGFGEIITETHQESGDITTHQFDALGRIYETVDPNGGHTKVDWDAAINGIGKVAGTHSPDNVDTASTYDAVGRPFTTSQTANGNSYRSEVHYDPQGRVSELLYPSIDASNLPALTLQYKYTSANYLYEIGYIAPGQLYQMLEHVTERNLDDALLKGEYGNALNTTRTYEPTTGRLSTEAVTLGANSSLFNLAYTYHPSGLVWTRSNATVNRLETFTFDGADRLSDWQNQYAGSSTNTHYIYDPTGNLTDVNNGIGYTEHNDYGSAGNAYPHALTKQTFSGGVTANYGYDNHGRQNSATGYGHDLSHGGPRTIPKYTHFDLPHTLTMNGKASTLLYNALGDRVSKTTPDGTTTYMGKLYEFRQESGQPQHVFHVYGPEGALADITQATAASPKVVTYLANDALGSVGAVITPAGSVPQRAYFEPFGRRINPDGSEVDVSTAGAVKNGFTGHEHDYEFGLINMRGRMYDPSSRRFLTPDPVVSSPLFGQSWNPYSYVNNSPLNATDPTGYFPCGFVCTDAACTPPPGCGPDKPGSAGPGAVPVSPGDWAGMAAGPF
ncbi:MAG: RHS repeat-associated core domain-containing protein, partial [Byssovorax sp.]